MGENFKVTEHFFTKSCYYTDVKTPNKRYIIIDIIVMFL